MKRKLLWFIMLWLVTGWLGAAYAAAYLNASEPDKIKKYVGQQVCVEGIVMDSHIAKSGKVRFLNFSPEYKSAFTVVIFTSDMGNFKSIGEPAEYYLGKRVVVSGRIKIYKGRPEIIVSHPQQIKKK